MKKPNHILPIFLLVPSLALFLPFYVYPFALSILTSFIEGNGRFTLAYYQTVVDVYSDDVFFSLWVCLLATFVSGAISIAVASYFKLSVDRRINKVFNQVFRLPLYIPMVVVAQMMRTFLAPHGTLNLTLAQIGAIDMTYPVMFFDWKGLLIGFVWKQTPFMMLIILSGVVMIKESYIEAARVSGAGYGRTLLQIILPIARPNIAIAFILTFASNISTFTLPYMLIGGAKPTTITVDMAHRVTLFGDWGTANALGVISYVLVGVFSIYYLREMTRRGLYER